MQFLINTTKKIGKEVQSRFGLAIGGAFAFVIALSWNEFIKEIVTYVISYLGLGGETLILKFVAAVLVTIICVAGIHYASLIGK